MLRDDREGVLLVNILECTFEWGWVDTGVLPLRGGGLNEVVAYC